MQQGNYVDGFVVPVKTGEKEAYRAIADKAARIFMRHGAVEVVECWADDVKPGKHTSFPQAVHLKDSETVVFAWIVWPKIGRGSQAQPLYAEYLDILKRDVEVVALKAGSAYKFCMMLEGKVDIYPRFHPTCEWDTSAGQCLIERIGGGLVDFKGRPFLYNQRDSLLNGGFIAFRNIELKKLAFLALAQMSHLPEI